MEEKALYEMAAGQSHHFSLIYYEINKKHQKPTDVFHFHRSLEFVFVTEGTFPVHVNGVSRVLNAGEIVCVSPGQPHYYTTSDYAKVFILVVGPDFLDTPLIGGRNLLPSMIRLPEKERAALAAFLRSSYRLWRETETSFPEGGKSSAFLGTGIFNTFYGFLMKDHSLPEPEWSKPNFPIMEVLKYIDTNYMKEISLRALAARFNYTETYFSTRFNDFTNMSLREYVNRIRISHADRLIGQGMPKNRAAALCGYTSTNTFYRAYRDYHDAAFRQEPDGKEPFL